MPATEQTWRDQRLLHVVFAVSSVLMLVSTLWMFAKDHDRSWKVPQKKAREIALTYLDWREAQALTDDLQNEHVRLQEELASRRSMPLGDGAKAQFEKFWDVAEDDGHLVRDGFAKQVDRYEEAAKEVKAAVAAYEPLRAKAEAAVAAVATAKQALETLPADTKPEDAKKAAERVDAAKETVKEADAAAAESHKELLRAQQRAVPLYKSLFATLEGVVKNVKDREDQELQKRKFTTANLDASKANLGLAVRDGRSQEELDRLQAIIDEGSLKETELLLAWQKTSARRNELLDILNELKKDEADLDKQLADNRSAIDKIQVARESRRSNFFEMYASVIPVPGKKWLELPILDAFNSPLKIDNRWSEGLEQEYGSFGNVRRFDRCTTCHQNMEQTQPGSATKPAYIDEHLVELTLLPPPSEDYAKAAETLADGKTNPTAADDRLLQTEKLTADEKLLEQLYGIRLADQGLLSPNDITVMLVRDKSLAAKAGVSLGAADTALQTADDLREETLKGQEPDANDSEAGVRMGDVVVAINGDTVRDRARAISWLLDAARTREPLQLTIRRGLPSPYTSHPRLDLFVGSLSPHKVSEFACTVCHDGQGSATSFEWASHYPDSERQRQDWRRDYGWFDNHHWIFPMQPKRFIESSCLKCHHDTNSLGPSEKFPDPPAPTLSHGEELIQKYGCFGCHEVNGYDGPNKRVGPDLRLEPNFFAAAQQLQGGPSTGYENLSDEAKGWVSELIEYPERDGVRHKLLQLIDDDKKSDEPKLTKYTQDKLGPLFKDIEVPGVRRKTGPSLRYVGMKADSAFLFDWIRKPKNFRPSTRMPQFFGLWDHLPVPTLEAEKEALEHERHELETERFVGYKKRVAEIDERLTRIEEDLASAERREVAYEPIEILGIVTYLQDRSQKFEYLDPPKLQSGEESGAEVVPADGVAKSDDEVIKRGEVLFHERGCLACHNHKAWPDAADFRGEGQVPQGPDLSGIARKFGSENGKKWLYSWIKKPSRYHVRTKMPDLQLEPIEHKDAQGKVLKTTDPVSDIVAYLMSSSDTGWKPEEGAIANVESLDESGRKHLDELVTANLEDAFYKTKAAEYLAKGIPERLRAEQKTAELELLVPSGQYDSGTALSAKQKMLYIGRKAIGKYGCYACHDIPGFEDAKPIGTGLADWGRKDTSKLAFEHILEYLHHGHGHGGHSSHEAGEGTESTGNDHDEAEGGVSEYYEHQLASHNRIGFLYQKLREPRSYDYHKTHNKKYNERLRMPLFPFNDEEREAVMTYVLGLVADPPTEKYVYQPSEREAAIIAGKQVLEKFNCGGCHVLEADRWEVSFAPGALPRKADQPAFPFLASVLSPDEIANSELPDAGNRVHGVLQGVPSIEDSDGKPIVEYYEEEEWDRLSNYDGTDEYRPSSLRYTFELWKPSLVDGQPYAVGQKLSIPYENLDKAYPSEGGYLAKYLLPYVVRREKSGVAELSRAANPNAKGTEAWAWVPPPLLGEGEKVQADWLHDFLLDPYPIRPLVRLRMPKFNMTSEEATALVNYFAAVDNADYPYEFGSRQRMDHLTELEGSYQDTLAKIEGAGEGTRFDHAMKILANKKSGCVQCHTMGDYSVAPKGPDLAIVYKRMKPGYLRQWLAKPTSILPYTAMPELFKYTPGTPDTDGFVIPKTGKYVHGTSTEQIDAVVDLLMNYDKYMQSKTSVQKMVEEISPAGAAADANAAESTDAAGGDSGADDADASN